jgi:hypothetical protein
MNPFTRAILAKLRLDKRRDRQAQDFVRRWDALEALVIRVYKAGQVSPEDETEHRRVHGWLTVNYPAWQPGLEPHWRLTRVAGELATEDPFAYLIEKQNAARFIGDWRAMQALPAAREALNNFLIGD